MNRSMQKAELEQQLKQRLALEYREEASE